MGIFHLFFFNIVNVRSTLKTSSNIFSGRVVS